MSTRTPRWRVACHLMNLGYQLHEDDIRAVHGGRHVVLNDTIERWSLFCKGPEGQDVEIQSAYTLTECAAGLVLEKNTRDSDLYGDWLAIPKKVVEEDRKLRESRGTTCQ